MNWRRIMSDPLVFLISNVRAVRVCGLVFLHNLELHDIRWSQWTSQESSEKDPVRGSVHRSNSCVCPQYFSSSCWTLWMRISAHLCGIALTFWGGSQQEKAMFSSAFLLCRRASWFVTGEHQTLVVFGVLVQNIWDTFCKDEDILNLLILNMSLVKKRGEWSVRWGLTSRLWLTFAQVISSQPFICINIQNRQRLKHTPSRVHAEYIWLSFCFSVMNWAWSVAALLSCGAGLLSSTRGVWWVTFGH